MKKNKNDVHLVFIISLVLVILLYKNVFANNISLWQKEIIYFIMIDRFCNGDDSNDLMTDKNNLKLFQGGDIKGIIKKLDYLKDLGITAIWITPVFKNQSYFVNSSGYHGYWPVDFYEIDEHFGDKKLFKELIKQAHKRKIKVIMDITLNHVAWDHSYVQDPEKYNWFHHEGDIADWTDPVECENRNVLGLPDFAQENPDLYKYLKAVSIYWIKEFKIDGFRLDAVKHIPHWFWKKYTSDIFSYKKDFFMIGEAFLETPEPLADYQSDGIPSLFDIPLYISIRKSIAQGSSMKDLAKSLEELNLIYPDPSMMGAFIDSHDTDRFVTSAGNDSLHKLRLALAFIYTINRIPVINYGTESAMSGHNEVSGLYPPENRSMMEFDKNINIKRLITSLSKIRSRSDLFSYGSLVNLHVDDKVYSYARINDNDIAVIILNNSEKKEKREVDINKYISQFNSVEFIDILTKTKYKVKNGIIKVELKRKQPVILMLYKKR